MVTWHGGKLARCARSSDAAELQATADAVREHTYIRLSLWEIVGGTAPLKKWQEVAAQVLATEKYTCALARCERQTIKFLKHTRSHWSRHDVGHVGHIQQHNEQTE